MHASALNGLTSPEGALVTVPCRTFAGVVADVQRVLSAVVTVDGEVVGAMAGPGCSPTSASPTPTGRPRSPGWPASLGAAAAPRRAVGLRRRRAVLVVSQFTLYGDARKGRRPTWQAAAPGPVSEPLYEAVCAELERLGAHVERGVFGADMRVESVNDGPITLLLESP